MPPDAPPYLTAAMLSLMLAAQAAADAAAGKPNWSLYFPVHMPGLELSQPVDDGEDVEIDADMLDLARHASSFFALGLRYDFRRFNRAMWLDLQGWHGGYGLDMDDLTARYEFAPGPTLKDLLDVNLEMQQAIVQGEWGLLALEDWHRLDIGITAGLRHYDQKIRLFGELPTWNPDCGRFGCFEARSFRSKEQGTWTEATLGLLASYHWRPDNTLSGSYSRGSQESSRWQLTNTFSFSESWFSSLGWRRDAFVNDGVEIIEEGLYLDVGKRFD